jgi:hypothetical protein
MSPITSKYKANDLGNPFQTGGEISLPFPKVSVFWHNGKPDADKTRGVYHYGGFFSGAEDITNELADFNIKPEAIGWKGDTWTDKDGKEYAVYSSRQIFVAPVANRKVWRKYVFEGVEKNKSTYSLLGFMAYPTAEKLCFLGPVIISASSYSGAMLEDAVKKWPSITAEARAKAAPNVPAWQFYIPIGTFGDKRVAVKVGNGPKTSMIVPAQIFVPDKGWTPEKIEKYFVPDEVVDQMIDTKKAADEWLNWKPDESKTQQDSRADDAPPEEIPGF